MRGEPALPRPASPVPPGLGTLVPAGHQEGDQGGLPGPPRHAQRRTQPQNTPRTRHLPPEQATAPAGGEHRAAADNLNRPSGLPGPWCAGTRMPGPEGASVQQCTGATRLVVDQDLGVLGTCLLYTSDAADDLLCVDL